MCYTIIWFTCFEKREQNNGITHTTIWEVSETYHLEALSRKQERKRGLTPTIIGEKSELDCLN